MLFHIAAAIKGFVRAFRVDRGLDPLKICICPLPSQTYPFVSAARGSDCDITGSHKVAAFCKRVSSVHEDIYLTQRRDEQTYPCSPWPSKCQNTEQLIQAVVRLVCNPLCPRRAAPCARASLGLRVSVPQCRALWGTAGGLFL